MGNGGEKSKGGEELELDTSKLERKVVTAFGDLPCHGPLFKGSGVINKAKETAIEMLSEPTYPVKIVYNDGELEVFCHFLWGKNCIVSNEHNTLCVYHSSRKIYRR